jgi:hypothetical protein
VGQPRPALPLATADLLSREELAIARSVLYASLFDYPLTLAQLRQTLIECVLTPTQIVAACEGSEALQSVVECRDGYYFPKGRADLCEERKRREQRSRSFLQQHRRLLALICAIPYVRMVALSGSIAHLNLEGGGDLDLFIVTRGRRVWSVTVAVLILAKLARQRRLVCANFVVADSRLALEQEDLFAASQIIHLRPLVGWDVYRQFIAANPFVARFYPNFYPDAFGPRFRRPAIFERAKRALETLLTPVSALAETACRWAYRRHLMRRAASWRSPEQVRLLPDCLKLHTRSHRQSILERFERAVRQLFDR